MPETQARGRLLIVDDDRHHCELCTAWLSDRFLISVAYDGEAGVEVARRGHPDVILLDIMLPKLSGFSLAWVFKHDACYAGTAVLFVTGVNVAAKTLERVDGYIRKPFRRDELLCQIDRALAKRRHLAVPRPVHARPPVGVPRRRAPRVDVRIPATLEVAGRVVDGAILSLSPWGAFFATDAPVPFDKAARVRFDDGGDPLELESHALYSALHKGTGGFGLRLRSREIETEARLNAIIERRLPDPGGPPALAATEDIPS